jgi:hypothetical protein
MELKILKFEYLSGRFALVILPQSKWRRSMLELRSSHHFVQAANLSHFLTVTSRVGKDQNRWRWAA